MIHCDAPRSEPKIALCSKLPCPACAKRLINLGGIQDLYIPEGAYGGAAASPAAPRAAGSLRTLSVDGPASANAEASIMDLLNMVGIRVHTVALT